MKKKLTLIIFFGILILIQPLSAQTWTASERLAWNSGLAYHPAIAVDSNNHIHVVWYDDTPGNDEIYYKKSTNGGTSWSTKRLTWNSDISSHTAIAVDSSDNIHIVWDDGPGGKKRLYYKKSMNGGVTWSTKRLS